MPIWIYLPLWFVVASLAGSAYALVAAAAHRRGGLGALMSVWGISSVGMGYWQYRRLCSQPLTCDVAGYPYWRAIVPTFTVMSAVTLVILSLVAVRMMRGTSLTAPPAIRLVVRAIAAGAIGVVAWVATAVTVEFADLGPHF